MVDWSPYEMFARTPEADDEAVVVPIIAEAGMDLDYVVLVSGRAARALAGVGTEEEVEKVRTWLLAERAKLMH